MIVKVLTTATMKNTSLIFAELVNYKNWNNLSKVYKRETISTGLVLVTHMTIFYVGDYLFRYAGC